MTTEQEILQLKLRVDELYRRLRPPPESSSEDTACSGTPDVIGEDTEYTGAGRSESIPFANSETCIDLWVVTGQGYDDGGDQNLYLYLRKLRLKVSGMSGETRVTIDAPVECTPP